MNEQLRISIVSYLNSAPFLHGLRNHPIGEQIELSEDYPSLSAEKLRTGAVDIGLIPSAILPQIPNGEIIGDYCIGCDGAVSSVVLLSHVPLEEIDQVLLDYQSRTSVQLVQILAKELWNITPEWLPASPGYETEVQGRMAAVVIGDRAMEISKQFPYSYDLGAAWKELTGLPFVFAVWTSNRSLTEDFKKSFNEALGYGLRSLPELVPQLRRTFMSNNDIEEYLGHYIRYEFKEKQRQGLALFLSKLEQKK